MSNERLIRKLENVDAVRRDLAAFLDRLGIAIRAGIANLRRGVPASSQTAEAAKVHVELVQKLDDMHSAVHQARAEGVRVLVEEEGLPVSAVAHLMGRPRQLVARLYQQARNGGARSSDQAVRRSPNGSPGHASAPQRQGANPRTHIPPAAR